MTLLRTALTAAPILGAFVWSASALAQAPVEWYTDTGGGGALARPTPESRDGGSVAPQTATGPDDLPQSDISATEPVHSPARASAAAEPVLGAPGSAPAQPRRERADAAPAQAVPTVTGGDDQDGSSAGPIADLPLTGLQLAIVAGAGLSLLLAGALLRPQRR
jgi:hypothetical protein